MVMDMIDSPEILYGWFKRDPAKNMTDQTPLRWSSSFFHYLGVKAENPGLLLVHPQMVEAGNVIRVKHAPCAGIILPA